MFEFVCKQGHNTEKLIDSDIYEAQCECGEISHRIVSAPNIKLEGWSGSFPGAAMKFDRIHAEKLKQEQKDTQA